MKVLVTGGSGYIGSHTCVQLLQQGHEVVILDNLCNSKRSVLPVIERLGGKEATFIEGDIRNEALMTEILHDHAIEAVIHFAGLKAVGESVAKPLEYYDNNVTGTLKLVSAMRAAGVKNFIFSSSATVYGDQPKIPYVESFPTGTPQSPYGKSKLMVEQILTDLQKAQPEWSIAPVSYTHLDVYKRQARSLPCCSRRWSPSWRTVKNWTASPCLSQMYHQPVMRWQTRRRVSCSMTAWYPITIDRSSTISHGPVSYTHLSLRRGFFFYLMAVQWALTTTHIGPCPTA